MRQSLRIIVSGKVLGNSFKNYVKLHAEKLLISGTVQTLKNKNAIVILAVGGSENLDEFIDYLYEGSNEVDDVQVEPLQQETNFRETFRIIGE